VDLDWIDATKLADLVRKREISPRDAVEAALTRIDERDGTINAVVTRMDDAALDRANQSFDLSQPFPGVPFLVKESASVAGVRASAASRYLRDIVAECDSELVTRYRRAGLIILGKTNMPEFGILGTTEPALFGPTRNPWDISRTAGGSSGGSAAAVAAGFVSMAHGGDSGGSIRIPASCCGVVGLKPSRWRNPQTPGSDVAGLSAEHAITRTVRDCARLLDATMDRHGTAGFVCPNPKDSFLRAATRDPPRLRVAFSGTSPLGFNVSDDCIAAVKHAAAQCEALGHEVEEGAPAFEPVLFDSFDALWMSELAEWIDTALQRDHRRSLKDETEPLTRAVLEIGRKRTAADFQRGLAGAQIAAARAAQFHKTFDVWMTPTLAAPPPLLGWFEQPEDDPLQAYRRDAEFCAFTPVANMTGQPAMSVPLHWNEQGLPIGVQLTAAFGKEDVLFALAGQLERAMGFASKHPPLAVTPTTSPKTSARR
jgi:amidase